MTEIRTNTHQMNGEPVRVIEIWQTHRAEGAADSKVLVCAIPIETDELITVIL